MKEWNLCEKREILGDQRMIQKYFHKNIFTKNIFTKIFSQNAKNISEKKNPKMIKKYCHKNIFDKNISGKKIPKIFSNLQNISEKNIFAKIWGIAQ